MDQPKLSRRQIALPFILSLLPGCNNSDEPKEEWHWTEIPYGGKVYRIYERKERGLTEVEIVERDPNAKPTENPWKKLRNEGLAREIDALPRKIAIDSGNAVAPPAIQGLPRAATVTRRSRIYLLDIYGQDRVIALDGETLASLGIVPTNQTGLVDMVLSPDGERLYVAIRPQSAIGNIPARPAAIQVFRTNPLALDRRIDLPSSVIPRLVTHAMALSPDGSTLYLANEGPFNPPVGFTASTLVRFDISSGRITGELGGLPAGRAFGPLARSADGRMLYSLAGSAVAFIDLTTFSLMTQVTVVGTDLVLHPDGSRLYVGASAPPRIEIIDTISATRLAPIRLADSGQVREVEITSNGQYLFAHNAASGSLWVADLDLGQKVSDLPSEPGAGSFAVGPG